MATSSAYVAAETFRFREGLNEKLHSATRFYGVIAAGILIGVLMDVLRIDPIKALFWSAVLNGVAAVPLIAVIVWLASDHKTMTEVDELAARARLGLGDRGADGSGDARDVLFHGNRRVTPLAAFAFFVVLGAISGFLGGLFGVGGALVTIPVLGIFFGFSEQVAQGTSLIVIVPNVMLSLWRYFRRSTLDLRMAATMALAGLPTTLIASWVATALVPSRHLRFAYALFLTLMLVEYARRSFLSKRATLHLAWGWVAAVGAIAGVLVGFFTVGGTLFSISVNTFLFSLTQLQAQGLALAYSTPATLLSAFVYARAGDVDWSVGIPLALGGVSTVSLAVDIAHRLPERRLRLLYIAFMLASSVSLLIKAARSG